MKGGRDALEGSNYALGGGIIRGGGGSWGREGAGGERITVETEGKERKKVR